MAAILSILAALLSLFSFAANAAEEAPSLRARAFSESTVRSARGLEYQILVSAPSGPPPQRGFPVIYVLDGDAWFRPALEIARMREYEKLTPPIIVGVSYPGRRFFDWRRTYDFSPPGSVDAEIKEAGGAVGGADEFLAFLNEKLKPWVRQRHRVAADAEILFGHSFGGMFALHALYTAPESFDIYLIASPSLLFCDKIVLKREAAFLGSPQRTSVRALVTVGEFEYPKISEALKEDYRRYYAAHPEETPGQTAQQAADDLFARRPDDGNATMAGEARALAERLSKAGVNVRFAYFEGEEHMSAGVSALNRGIPFALRPMQ